MGKESILQKLRVFNQSSVTPFTLHHFHTAVSLKGALQFCVQLNLCTASAVMMTTGNTACLVTLFRRNILPPSSRLNYDTQ